jgi:hypothetical protein
MESTKLTEEMLFRQVKSAIAGHDFKAARKKLELHLDDAQDNPRIWELYGNVLKKLGKTDKARTAFLHRDELRRDDLALSDWPTMKLKMKIWTIYTNNSKPLHMNNMFMEWKIL